MKLKSAIALMFAMPVIAFGGTCYQATSTVPASVPGIFCVDSIEETYTPYILSAKGPNNNFPTELKIIHTSRHNEERLNFTAVAVVAEEWNSGCGDGFSAVLNVKGEIAYGDIATNDLNLFVEIKTTNDTCHSKPDVETISYKKL
jgi:hypothetical protein